MKRLSGLGENHHNYDRLNLYILIPHILLYIVDHEKIIILKFIKKIIQVLEFFFFILYMWKTNPRLWYIIFLFLLDPYPNTNLLARL